MSWQWIPVIAAAAVLVAAAVRLYSERNKEIVSQVETLNANGAAGSALLVYHPGKSTFQRRVFRGFAEGLVS